MRLVINQKLYGWKLTGLIGKDGKWFLGIVEWMESECEA